MYGGVSWTVTAQLPPHHAPRTALLPYSMPRDMWRLLPTPPPCCVPLCLPGLWLHPPPPPYTLLYPPPYPPLILGLIGPPAVHRRGDEHLPGTLSVFNTLPHCLQRRLSGHLHPVVWRPYYGTGPRVPTPRDGGAGPAGMVDELPPLRCLPYTPSPRPPHTPSRRSRRAGGGLRPTTGGPTRSDSDSGSPRVLPPGDGGPARCRAGRSVFRSTRL